MKLCAILSCFFFMCSLACAEGLPPFVEPEISVIVEQNGIDTATMVKLNRIKLDEALVREAIDAYCVTPAADESWILELNSQRNPDFALIYSDQSGHVGTICCDYIGPPSANENQSETLRRASETVRSFLESIGLVHYEYPFYFCDYEYKTLVGSAWHSITEEEYLDSGYTSKEAEQQKWDRLGGPMIYVVVRFLANEYPLGTSISWTDNTNSAGNGNPTPSAVFGVTHDGKIAAVTIRNPVEVVSQRDSSEPLLSWESILSMNAPLIADQRKKNDLAENNLILRYAELIMMTNDNNIAFPAWHLVFEEWACDEYARKYYGDGRMEGNSRYSTVGKYFDATTGKAVLN